MRILKQELYFPLIIGIHFIIWVVALYFYNGTFMEVKSDTLFFGELTNQPWLNVHRILGEVLSSWVVTVFAINFLMATRARWIEKIFGGLDKMYMIHRRAGVIAVVLLIAHFIVVPKDLVAFNIGKPLGLCALILILVGVIISATPVFKKKIPYHKWINFHKLMGPFYILAVIHGAMVHSLIKELPLVRTYVFGMAIIGVGAWFYKAFFYGVFNKKLDYVVSSVNNLGNGITEIYLNATGIKLKFKAGQFAFFTFPSLSKREQHPFTISSHHLNDEIRVTVKGLGDYTNKITENLKEGAAAKIEGPFGLFSSRYAKEKEQIWIAGGIGITPFFSLSKDIYTHKVKLIWSVINKEEAKYSEELTSIANENPNFQFIIWSSNDSGFLTADQFGISEFKDKGYLICGPGTLKKSIIKQLSEKGVKRDDIYDEEFAFR
ncbi:MAG: ferric reductase-like transmembrane domain-containing protein [Bacteroidales bacterium]|nr:ferric reductase-like transmembrane domain-containing protein [Bacteroidales bacterium]